MNPLLWPVLLQMCVHPSERCVFTCSVRCVQPSANHLPAGAAATGSLRPRPGLLGVSNPPVRARARCRGRALLSCVLPAGRLLIC